MQCKKCGAEYEGKFCPTCGKASVKKKLYKRWWFWLIIVIIIIMLIPSEPSTEKTNEVNYTISDSTSTSPQIDDSDQSTEIVTVKKGQTVTVTDICEFFLDYTKITSRVLPPTQGGGIYSYYDADSGKTYVDICIGYKNLGETSVESDEIGSVTLKYANKYEYTGFSVGEEDNRSDFRTYLRIDPLNTEYIHYLVEVPKEVSTSDESVVATLNVAGNSYNINIK